MALALRAEVASVMREVQCSIAGYRYRGPPSRAVDGISILEGDVLRALLPSRLDTEGILHRAAIIGPGVTVSVVPLARAIEDAQRPFRSMGVVAGPKSV